MPADSRQVHPAPFDSATFLLPAELHALSDLLGGEDTAVLVLRDGQIVQLNATLAARLGYLPWELTERPLDSIIPESNRIDGGDQAHPAQARHIVFQDRQGAPVAFELTESRIDPLSDGRCHVWVMQPLAAAAGEIPLPPAAANLLAITEQLPDLVLVSDTEAVIRYGNKAFDAFAGDHHGLLTALVHPDDRETLNAALTRAAAAESAPLEVRMRRRDGAWAQVSGTVSNLLPHPDVQGLLLNLRDISRELAQQQRMEAERKRHLHYLNRLLRIARQPQSNREPALKVILKSAAKALAVQRCAYWEFGKGRQIECVLAYDDVRQNYLNEIPDEQFRRVFLPLLRRLRDTRETLAVADVDRDARAALYCEYFHAAGIKALIAVPVKAGEEQDGILLFTAFGQQRAWRKDETEFAENAAALVAGMLAAIERSRAESRLREIALHDRLTGLPNRDYLLRRAAEIFPRLSASADTLAAFFIDLDGFTDINDRVGHLLGDELLKAAALRLKNTVRRDDVLVRLGGDEFLLLVRDLRSVQVADEIARQIIDSISGVFSLQGQELGISASVGVALYPTDGTDLESLMKKADRALFHAKSSGRGQYRVASSMRTEAPAEEALRSQLRRALEQRELRHCFQPQLDLRSGTLRGVEAMLRWQHPEHGMLLPASFLPLAERTGLMRAITAWALEDASRQLARWDRLDANGFTLAFKLSAVQLTDPALPRMLDDILRCSGVPPHRLEWEIKESVVAGLAPEAAAQLEYIAAMRAGLSIDDFGASGTDLGYLRRYPVHKVKINVSPAAGGNRDLVDAAIALAQRMGLEVVAKGVETSQQVENLRERGCDIAQGYYYTQPLNAEQFDTWLTRR